MTRVRRFCAAHPLRAIVAGAVLVNLLIAWIYLVSRGMWHPHSDNHSYLAKGTYFYQHFDLQPIAGIHGPDADTYWPKTFPLRLGNMLGLQHHVPVPDTYWPPLYPMALGTSLELRHLLSGIIGQPLGRAAWPAFCLVTLDGIFNVIGVAFIAKRLLGTRAAAIAAWITALFLPLVLVGSSLFSESLLLPIEICWLSAMIEYRHRPRRRLIVAIGVLLGLAMLTRSDSIVLAIPTIAGLWFSSPLRAGWRPVLVPFLRGRVKGGALAPLGRRLLPIGVALVAACCVMSPWWARNEIELHQFVPLSSSFGITVAGEYNDWSSHTDPPGRFRVPLHIKSDEWIFHDYYGKLTGQDTQLLNAGLKYIGQHPGAVPTDWFWNTVRLFELDGPGYSQISAKLEGIPYGWTIAGDLEVYMLLAVLVVGGVLTAARRLRSQVVGARSFPHWIWLAPLGMYFACVFLNTETPRFRAPIDPFLILLATSVIAPAFSRLAIPVRRVRAAELQGSGQPVTTG
ncbi:MAG: glycosyltransferase family 39 protein [Solirubrobacterales bacterium]|nr:glycosyltransferase family 39 protein [Solirubrobacterales bacterium]